MESIIAKRRCATDCQEHNFDLKHVDGTNKYEIVVSMCPKYLRGGNPPEASCPVYNLDRKHYSDAFVLGQDLKAIRQNHQQDWMKHQRQIRESLEKNNPPVSHRKYTQLEPKPSDKHMKCAVCKEVYISYVEHIKSDSHIRNIRENAYNTHLRDLCCIFEPLWVDAQKRALANEKQRELEVHSVNESEQDQASVEEIEENEFLPQVWSAPKRTQAQTQSVSSEMVRNTPQHSLRAVPKKKVYKEWDSDSDSSATVRKYEIPAKKVLKQTITTVNNKKAVRLTPARVIDAKALGTQQNNIPSQPQTNGPSTGLTTYSQLDMNTQPAAQTLQAAQIVQAANEMINLATSIAQSNKTEINSENTPSQKPEQQQAQRTFVWKAKPPAPTYPKETHEGAYRSDRYTPEDRYVPPSAPYKSDHRARSHDWQRKTSPHLSSCGSGANLGNNQNMMWVSNKGRMSYDLQKTGRQYAGQKPVSNMHQYPSEEDMNMQQAYNHLPYYGQHPSHSYSHSMHREMDNHKGGSNYHSMMPQRIMMEYSMMGSMGEHNMHNQNSNMYNHNNNHMQNHQQHPYYPSQQLSDPLLLHPSSPPNTNINISFPLCIPYPSPPYSHSRYTPPNPYNQYSYAHNSTTDAYNNSTNAYNNNTNNNNNNNNNNYNNSYTSTQNTQNTNNR